MKIKDSDIYKKYLEYSSNPQAKALISLCFWFLFFLAVVLFARFSSKQNLIKDNYVNERINSYEFTYKDEKDTIYGKSYNGKYVFNSLNTKYYYDGSNVYEIKGHDASLINSDVLKYLKISPKMISDLTDNLSYDVFGDELVYKIPLSKFLNLFDFDVPINLDSLDKYDVKLSKFYSKGLLYKVKIDLSSYYLYKNEENRGIITIDFYEQNKINDFTDEYDEMIGVVK